MSTVPDSDVLAAYAAALKKLDLSMSTEDDLKTPVKTMLEGLSGAEVVVGSEHTAPVGRPDLKVYTSDLARVVGYVELKNMRKDADPRILTGIHDKEQWEAFKVLPNLVYCNGSEATLWRDGAQAAKRAAVGDTAGWAALWDEFLAYTPTIDSDAKALAKTMGRRARLLRRDVRAALSEGNGKGNLDSLFRLWREFLIADMDEDGFADNFAQTAMAGLLLAKGLATAAEREAFSLPVAGAALRRTGHGMVAEVLSHIDSAAQSSEALAVSLSAIVDGAAALDSRKPSDDSWWVDFYEAFIREYDRRLQQDRGVFYTPNDIVDYQIRSTDWVLRELLGKPRGFAHSGVVTLDPACGTGTYLTRLIEHAAAQTLTTSGPGAVAEAVAKTAESLFGFELMVAPYTVARMRLAAKCEAHSVVLGPDRVLLTDTLSAVGIHHTGDMFAERMAEQQEQANLVKDPQTRVTVVIGNPPYDRDQSQADSADKDSARRLGGMIRHGEEGQIGLLKDFVDRTPPGMRGQLHTIYELATYFWRWGVWKVCEQQHQGAAAGGPGVVSFITPSAWLRSDPWAGMRAHLRARFDRIWVVDLGGDQRSARDDGANVFPIQTPVCIAVAVRIDKETDGPAIVWYRKLAGARSEKLAALGGITLDGDGWAQAPSGKTDRFLPAVENDWYAAQPPVDKVLRWRPPGVQYNRGWPIAVTEDVLDKRWERLTNASTEDEEDEPSERARLFKETRDRTLDSDVKTLDGSQRPTPRTIRELLPGHQCPKPVEYAHRPFDTRWAIPDNRVGDMMRADLWARHSAQQAYLVTATLGEAAGDGPTAVVYAHIPDKNSHHGRAGVVFPLWRDNKATDANADEATVAQLTQKYGQAITGEQLWHYCAGLLGTAAYPQRWADPMGSTLKPHIPFPDSHADFAKLTDIGRRVVQIARGIRLDKSGASCAKTIDPSKLPDFSERCYNAADEALRFGGGEITGITAELWNHQVSDYRTLRRWIKARSSSPGGRTTSELDKEQPDKWIFTASLIEVCDKIASLNSAAEEAMPILTRMTAPV